MSLAQGEEQILNVGSEEQEPSDQDLETDHDTESEGDTGRIYREVEEAERDE